MLASFVTAALLIAAPPAPRAHPVGQSPDHEGVGQLSMGVLFGAGWLTTKLMVTTVDPFEVRDPNFDERRCVESCLNGPLLHTLGVPVLVGTMGFLGGGMRTLSRHRVRSGYALRWRPDATPRRLMTLGGVLIAGGGAVLASGLGVAYGTGISTRGRVALVETMWWATAGLGISGSMILGIGHGRKRGRADRQTRVTPVATDSVRGVSISGRF